MSDEVTNNQSLPEAEKTDSKEILEELRHILKKAVPSSFIVPDGGDRETIYKKSKKLSFDERANLFKNFLCYPGTILFDAGGLFEAKIRIDDKHSEISENRPLAYIEFSDGYNSRVEVIDILESVRNDAILIGHPVILYAIHHWQKILIWEKYNKNDDVYSEDEFNELADYQFKGRYIESARQNLEAIGKAMLEAARRQAIPKELAFTLKLKSLKIENKNTYLYVAWDRLASKNVNQTHGLSERISQIENYLRLLPANNIFKRLYEYPKEFQKYGYIDATLQISTVIYFLKADGNKFVYDETSYKSTRPQWRVFKNAFIKWYYRKEVTTIEKYQNIANKQEIDEKPYLFGLIGGSSRKTSLFRWLSYVLCKPLVKICEPIECSSEIADSHKFTDLINQTKTK